MKKLAHTLNDYLWDKCDILSTVQDVTPKLGIRRQREIVR